MSVNRKKILLFIFVAFLLSSAMVRMIHPRADAPFDLSWSQGPSTDASYYIEPAVNFVKGRGLKPISGIWNAPGYYLLYLPFLLLFGVGYAQLNLITAAISLLGFVFFFLIVKDLPKRDDDITTALFASLFWAFTTFFVMYNRIPLIYTAMILYMLVSAWLWFLGTKRRLFFIFSWAVIFIAVLYVRVIAVALVPAFLIGHILLFFGEGEGRRTRVIRVVTLLAIAAAGIALVLFVGKLFNLSPLDIALARVKAHLKGDIFGDGLLVYFFNIGESGGITRYLPVVSLLAYSYIIVFVRDLFAKRLNFKDGKDVMKVVILAWAVFGAFYTILFKYAPPRYFLFLMPPLFILAGMTCARLLSPEEKRDFGYGYYFILLSWLLFLVFRVILIVFSYLISNFTTFAVGFRLSAEAVARFSALIKFFGSFYLLLSISLILSLLIIAAIYLIDRAGERKEGELAVRREIRVAFIVASMAFFLYYQGAICWRWAENPHYTLVNTSRELARLVNENAVVSGPYAHPLTIENDLRHIYMTFTKPKSKTPCERFKESGTTHLLIDSKNGLVYIERLYPETFDCLDLIDTFYVRGNAVGLYACKDRPEYTPTYFERAQALMGAGDFEEAEKLLLKSIGEGAPASAEYASLGRCKAMLKDREGAEEALEKAIEINPDNLPAHWGLGQLLEAKGDREGALSHYLSVLDLYPESKVVKKKIRELIVETNER
ncbi:MAG: tetratricopeptide repeat protein [Deltaproteobacteria bacterium]|uniref:Tetratricopeptide repeat protein n=1 Tax=Candidatus Zymogenus saltonus TaxID=2844893 RepID=A0A9D8KBS0_9DELT|nr:tetratricopeptide repeat protein [Candidatus Zymogenus saltonus]